MSWLLVEITDLIDQSWALRSAHGVDADQIRSKNHKTLLVKLLPESMSERFIDMLLSVSEHSTITPGQVLFKLGETNTDQGLLFLEGTLKNYAGGR